MKEINEKELRLGNLILGIYYTEDDEGEEIEHDDICEVLAINDGNHFADHSIYVDSKSDTEIFSSFKAIPLTEELFSKLPDEEWLFVGIGGRKILQHKKFKAIEIEYSNNQVYVYFNNKLINIKDYLHELQNLYFALTSEELKIKHN